MYFNPFCFIAMNSSQPSVSSNLQDELHLFNTHISIFRSCFLPWSRSHSHSHSPSYPYSYPAPENRTYDDTGVDIDLLDERRADFGDQESAAIRYALTHPSASGDGNDDNDNNDYGNNDAKEAKKDGAAMMIGMRMRMQDAERDEDRDIRVGRKTRIQDQEGLARAAAATAQKSIHGKHEKEDRNDKERSNGEHGKSGSKHIGRRGSADNVQKRSKKVQSKLNLKRNPGQHGSKKHDAGSKQKVILEPLKKKKRQHSLTKEVKIKKIIQDHFILQDQDTR